MGKTTFHPSNLLNRQTPAWARWLFKVIYVITTSLAVWVAATNRLEDALKYEVTIFLKLMVDPVMLAVSEMFGVRPIVEAKKEDEADGG